MKKNIILTILSIIIGVLLAKFMFNQYGEVHGLVLLKNKTIKYYFIQLGAYSSYDSMISNTSRLEKFIYREDSNLFYVFGCITKNEENLDKIQGFYKDNGYTSYVKEFNLSNTLLSDGIDNIDLFLNTTNDNEEIEKLCSKSITLYKEG